MEQSGTSQNGPILRLAGFEVDRATIAKLVLLGGSITATLLLALLPQQYLFDAHARVGYWTQATLCLVLLYLIVRMLWGQIKALRDATNRAVQLRQHVAAVLLIAVASVFLHSLEPHLHRIIWDEYCLSATSVAMHKHHAAVMPTRAHDIDGSFVLLNADPVYRPCLFPFLVSFLHDVTGYRAANGFLLNILLTPVLLTLVYVIGLRFGSTVYGLLGVLLITGQPLVAQTATSAGYDLLNLTLIAALLVALLRYLDDAGKCKWQLDTLLVIAVLLPQVRYESLFYLVFAVSSVGWVWWRFRTVKLSWFSAITPVFLLSPLWVVRIYQIYSVDWPKPEGGAFTFANLFSNIGHAANYFFSPDKGYANSPLLTALGVLAIVLVIWQYGRSRQSRTHRDDHFRLAFLGMLIVTLATFLFLQSFYWAELDDPMASRFALPLGFMLSISILAALKAHLAYYGKSLSAWSLAVVAAYILVLPMPRMARHEATRQMDTATLIQWQIDTVQQNTLAGERIFVVAPGSLHLISHSIPGITLERSRLVLPRLKALHQSGSYDRIFLLNAFYRVGDIGALVSPFDHVTTAACQRKLLARAEISEDKVAHLYEVTDVVVPADYDPEPYRRLAPEAPVPWQISEELKAISKTLP